VKVVCRFCHKILEIEVGLFQDLSICKCDSCGGPVVMYEQPKPEPPRPVTPEVPALPDIETLDEAKTYLNANLRDGVICPCCGQFAKIYKRKFNSWMARAMIAFYAHEGMKPGWFHAISVVVDRRFWKFKINNSCGDYGKLVWWGLLEEAAGHREDGNPETGYYRMTQKGRDFVLGKIRVRKYIHIYNDTLLEVDGEKDEIISIHEAMGAKFNYSELMSA